MQIPYEILNKKFRITQKTLDRELSQIQTAAFELEKGLTSEKNLGEISRLLGGVVDKLQVLKRKAEENISEEISAGFVCKRRLEHLKQNCSTNSHDEDMSPSTELQLAASNQWKKIRLNRMIVEHFLRLGYYETAETLAVKVACQSGIKDLTNIGGFNNISLNLLFSHYFFRHFSNFS